jgi:acetyl esterase/lipase
MKTAITYLLLLSVASLGKIQSQNLTSDVPYADPAHKLQVLDIYAPSGVKDLPVVFWIHGGGWRVGDKTEVHVKPRVFTERGFVFVSTNYRLLPQVEMDVLIRDVAKSLGWVHKNIAQYGGDPGRIFVMGHSAGAQLAALLCTDDRLLKAEGVSFDNLKGCVPLDGDTYDLPAIIMTAELSQTLHGLPLPEYGHRAKFGNDPKKHIDFSAVTHVAKGKGIPPFLILHITENPNTTAQARRLGAVLNDAGIPVQVFGARETTHNMLNANIGLPDDPATKELWKFLDLLVGEK